MMTRTGNLEREAHSLEILPAALRMDLAPKLFAHPLRDFGAAPQAAIGRSLYKLPLYLLLVRRREQGWCAEVRLALIGEGFWSVLIVASSENPDPVGTVARYLGHLPDVLALRE